MNTGQDNFEWFHHPWLPGSYDLSSKRCRDDAGRGGGAVTWEGGAAGPCGLMLWQFVYQVSDTAAHGHIKVMG